MAIDGVVPPPPRAPDDGLPVHEVIAAIHACLAALEDFPSRLGQLAPDELADAMAALLRLRGRSEQLAALTARRAAERGDVKESDAANTAQWVAECAVQGAIPLDRRDAHTIAAVAEACDGASGEVVVDAMTDGTCTAAVAKSVLAEFARIRPVIPVSSRADALRSYLEVDPVLGPRGLQQRTRHILATFAPEELDKSDAALESTETLTLSSTPTGMTRLIAELAPVNAAIVKDAILAFSAPQSASAATDDTGSRQTCPDDRAPGKRRVDALVTLISAAAKLDGEDAPKVGPCARMTVTVPLTALTDRIGVPLTSTGDHLDAGAARRLACDAEIIPVVLGTNSEPLDVGRSKRLVPKGIRTAVELRDGGCTFPGCDRPPQFCEIHHVVPWAAGGETALLNSAMLCTTHHQIVHRREYTAVATALSVAWDLTPGRMAGPHRPAA